MIFQKKKISLLEQPFFKEYKFQLSCPSNFVSALSSVLQIPQLVKKVVFQTAILNWAFIHGLHSGLLYVAMQ